jgi:glycosyltransferase involved in cell wall biosynthesis
MGQAICLVMHGVLDRTEIAKLMAECDFFVLPTYGESFGLAVAEALCMGMPVVTTSGTACAGYVGADDGVLVEPRSSESLKTGLIQLVANLNRFDRVGISSRARSRFSSAAVACWYADLYRRVMARSAGI